MYTHNVCFEQKFKKYQFFSGEISMFIAEKIPCLLHGQVFVMCLHVLFTMVNWITL